MNAKNIGPALMAGAVILGGSAVLLAAISVMVHFAMKFW